jgi:hypothetical protein
VQQELFRLFVTAARSVSDAGLLSFGAISQNGKRFEQLPVGSET